MKTPEEWIQSKTHCVNKNVITDRFKEADIAAIQADARRELEAQLCQSEKDRQSNGEIADTTIEKLEAAEQRVKELERELADANHWRERHCKDAILYGNRSQENWERANAAIERERVLREAIKQSGEWFGCYLYENDHAGIVPKAHQILSSIRNALAATGKEGA